MFNIFNKLKDYKIRISELEEENKQLKCSHSNQRFWYGYLNAFWGLCFSQYHVECIDCKKVIKSSYSHLEHIKEQVKYYNKKVNELSFQLERLA